MPATYELHISDVRTFKSCRRRWDWSSPLRRHLEPIVTPRHFLVGKAVHYGLATFYETGEMPADVFDRYMKVEMEKLGVLWPDEVAIIEKDRALGVGMLENYMRWVHSYEAPDERWEIIATEQAFGPLPLFNPQGRKSNRVFLAGRFDGIIRDRETGLLWLREFKTAGREPNPDWLELDDQLVTYCNAAQQIMGEPVAGIQYRFLMKKAPDKPPRLKNGGLSKAINSPQTMSTNYDMYNEALNELAYERALAEYGLDPVADNIPFAQAPDYVQAKQQTHYDALKPEYAEVLDVLWARGYNEYFRDFEVTKTQAELADGASDLWLVGLEMVRPTTAIYKAPDWLKCQFCPFKSPCKIRNAGGNFEAVLKHEFRTRQPEAPVEESNRVGW